MKKVFLGAALVLGISFFANPQQAFAWCYSIGNGETQCVEVYRDAPECDGGQLAWVTEGVMSDGVFWISREYSYCRTWGVPQMY